MPQIPPPQPVEIDNGPAAGIPLGVALGTVESKLREIIARCAFDEPEILEVVAAQGDQDDPSIKMMLDIVDSINHGKNISAQFERIQQLTHRQDFRAEIMNRLALNSDFGRFAKFLAARGKIESVLLAIADKGNLSPAEALAFLTYLNGQISTTGAKIASSSVSSRDIGSVLDQMNFLVEDGSEGFKKKLAETTPQNREIIRRLAFRIGKAASNAGNQR